MLVVEVGLGSRPRLRSRLSARTVAAAAAAFAWTDAAWSGGSGRLRGPGASPVPPRSGGRRPNDRVLRRHEPAVAVARNSAQPARAGSEPPGRLCSTRRRAGSTQAGPCVAAGRQRLAVPEMRRCQRSGRCHGTEAVPGGAETEPKARCCHRQGSYGTSDQDDRGRPYQRDRCDGLCKSPRRRGGSPTRGSAHPPAGGEHRPASRPGSGEGEQARRR